MVLKWNWKLTPPHLFKTSGNLNSSAHYSLLFVFIVLTFGDQTSASFTLPSPFEILRVRTGRPPFPGLCVFRLVLSIRSTNASVQNDLLLIGPEVLACDCFTPGLWLSVGGGSFSENWTVEKWPFLSLKLFLKSEGLDQKKRNIRLESRRE